MKLFDFDPKTGRRGELVGTAKRIDWTSEYLPGAPEPVGFGSDAEVTVHRDAGIGIGEDEHSYRHPTEWRAMCMGNWHMGGDVYRWTWVVLPPLNYEENCK